MHGQWDYDNQLAWLVFLFLLGLAILTSLAMVVGIIDDEKELKLRQACVERGGTYSENRYGRFVECAGVVNSCTL